MVVTYEKMFKAPSPWPEEYVELNQLLKGRVMSEEERVEDVQ